jgi:hypothetical protein
MESMLIEEEKLVSPRRTIFKMSQMFSPLQDDVVRETNTANFEQMFSNTPFTSFKRQLESRFQFARSHSQKKILEEALVVPETIFELIQRSIRTMSVSEINSANDENDEKVKNLFDPTTSWIKRNVDL